MKFAFLFPGQGSQSIGMMQGLDALTVVRDTFAEASAILGQDLWVLITEGPVEQLNLTVNTQPVMLVAGVATYRAWLEQGGRAPDVMAGHSLGEYSALVAAGALTLQDALPLVRLRATAMQSAVAEGVGAMAAILGLDDEIVRAVCAEAAQGEVLEAVNFNSPGQVVIAGHKAAVERGMVLAKEKGAKRALPLPVSVPSHCALMRPAAEQLAAALANVAIQPPQIPVLHNADVAAYTDPDQIRDALARQLYSPVRWVESVQAMAHDGVALAAECGPGKVLAGLTKRIDERVAATALISVDAITEFKTLIG
ncbi:[acyl-carrier-protein] S-malonyltransferase [Sulfuriferula sp. AH1]|uniref:ACP S-malonyltransferase n=1 Tax=Sulfuriferula sp. AH1 TaxID=1985873 RepID=UPI000B3B4A5D|nr:ACP S-malonyltransferase [Sulfuriferula sp. AH1]ARU31629.1 [acyl-carrier-protein] S-malonyltransferase [Sulfuriferula sp. AH1]